MSLLMDALRKAEADKKAAAARAAGQAPDGGGEPDRFARTAGELRLEPLNDGTSDSFGLSRSDEFTAGFSTVTQRLSASGRFRAPPTDATLAEALSFPSEAPPPTPSDTGSLTRPELVTARTVFAATASRRVNPLALGISLVLFVLVTGAGLLGYRYYAQAPSPIVLPSPRVALGVERETPPSPPVPTPAIPLAAPRVADVAPPDSASPEIAPPAASGATASPPPAAPPLAELAADLQRLAAQPAPQTGESPPAAAPLRPRPATLPQDVEMQNGDLRIARSARTVTAARRQLRAAYAAFEAGDLVGARRDYVAVLERIPGQRDALLGLGAIALANQRPAEAHAHYAAVLSGTPDDPVATAALFLIEGGRGAAATEAKLKLLLDRGLDAPYLHFALGNLYAREQRWGDAQLAYFEAFRAQPRNADYAFNLAVSLDRLGQRTTALDYYRQAEALRGPHSRFDGAAVAARIASLSGP